MEETININIRPKSSILSKYRDYSYKLETAIAEFVDNSTESYSNKNIHSHDEILKSKANQEFLTINIQIYQNEIQIIDNAFGMNFDDFQRAIILDSPPSYRGGRSEKGMGLKTAATWLGSWWSVETTEFGSDKLYIAEIDVDEIEKYAPDIVPAKVTYADPAAHYTIIKIRKLNRNNSKIQAKRIEQISKNLAKMYHLDIMNGKVKIFINNFPLSYEYPQLWKDDNHNDYRTDFQFKLMYDGRMYDVFGWAGIVKVAMTDGAGFTLLRRGRGIQTGYRPQLIFGRPNSFPYQRMIGELNLDDWDISQTKDSFLWDGGLEENLLRKLKPEIQEIIDSASVLRKYPRVKTPQFSLGSSDDETTDKDNESLIRPNNPSTISDNQTMSAKKSDSITSVMPSTPTMSDSNEFKFNIGNEECFISIKYVSKYSREWISIKTMIGTKNKYQLDIDNSVPFLEKYKDDSFSLDIFSQVALILAKSLIQGIRIGILDFEKYLTLINDNMKSRGE